MAARWQLSDRTLEFDRPIGVGIVNVTSDSFFEGARSETPERAIRDALELIDRGFEMIDVGTVTARIGPAVDVEEEAGRLIPAIEGLVESTKVPVSADTFSPEVARRAVEAGAVAINDIGGGEPAMLELVAETGCGLVLMHIEGRPRQKREPPHYDDPVDHLRRWFSERIEAAVGRGVAQDQIAIDPGLDFDLGIRDDLEIMRRLSELKGLGRALYVSLSRKDFLGAVIAGSWEERLPATEREWATCAAAALAVGGGADLLRLHDASALQSLQVAASIEAERGAHVG